jgi:hypothetical protein
MGKGQFHVKSDLFDALDALDNSIVDHVQKGDDAAFRRTLDQLIGMILRSGTKLDDRDLVASDIIVPPADMTLAEARAVFRGTGLFKS